MRELLLHLTNAGLLQYANELDKDLPTEFGGNCIT